MSFSVINDVYKKKQEKKNSEFSFQIFFSPRFSTLCYSYVAIFIIIILLLLLRRRHRHRRFFFYRLSI